MTLDEIESELLFTEVRQHSPQWEVTFLGKLVARVTERYIAEPHLALNLVLADGEESHVHYDDDRSVIMRKICEHVLAMHV